MNIRNAKRLLILAVAVAFVLPANLPALEGEEQTEGSTLNPIEPESPMNPDTKATTISRDAKPSKKNQEVERTKKEKKNNKDKDFKPKDTSKSDLKKDTKDLNRGDNDHNSPSLK